MVTVARCGAAIALAVVLALAREGHADLAPRPNILLISLDTVRADFLSFRDAETARNMTALAEHGTVFRQAIAGSSWTLPTHAQIFTGSPPTRHGVESDFERIDPLTPMLTERLHDAGWFTTGQFTVRYLWADYGFGRGFDLYSSAMEELPAVEEPLQYAPRDRKRTDRRPGAAKADNITSPRVVALARRALERARPDQPVFLFAHFFDPHHDYTPPSPWDEAFDPDYDGEIDGRNYLFDRRITDLSRDPVRQIGERDLEHIKSLYRGEIAWVDQWVGELLALFESHGRLDDTLVIITADHGEEFFDHGYIFHRTHLLDELVRVPLLIVPPRALREGIVSSVDSQVSLSDIMPTILDYAALDVPPSVLGRSLRPAMHGGSLPSRPELLSLFLPADPESRNYVDRLHQAIRTPEFKFVRQLAFRGDGRVDTVVKYFDLVSDPGEQSPIVAFDHPRVAAGWNALEDEIAALREHWRAQPRSPDAERRTDVRETFEEELMALGYVEAGDRPEQSDAAPRPWGGLEPPGPLHRPGASGILSSTIANPLVRLGVAAIGVAALVAVALRRRARRS